MTKSYYFFGEINPETVNNCIEKIDSFGLDLEKDELHFFINSQGGDIGSASVLSMYLSNKYKILTIIATGMIASSAFDIVFGTSSKDKVIAHGAIGLVHIVSAEICDRSTKDISSYEYFLKKNMEKESLEYCEWLDKIGLTPNEVAKVQTGKDLYLSYERLRELLKQP